MAKVTYLDPIDHLSGKIAKAYRTTYMHRTAATSNAGTPNYTHVRGERTTPLSSNEVAIRQKFADTAKAVRERMQNPAQITTDTVAFKAQTTYKTLYQYLWHQVADTME